MFTVAEITSLYLYGTQEKPENPDDRIRQTNETITETIDAVEYMSTIGRFALPSGASIIKDLFAFGPKP